MTEPTTPAFVVRSPFDSKSNGDCILQASDGAEFYVYRVFLCMGSAVFHDMFDMPPAPSGKTEESNHAVPVVPLQEDAETLQALLQLMHPIDPPSITSLKLAQKLVTACDKYFISTAKLRVYLRIVLNEDRFLREEPLTCYGLSWKLGLEQEAIRASRYTHFLDLADSSLAGPLLSCSGDLEAVLALWRLRNAREDALDGVLSLVKSSTYIGCRASGHGNPSITVSDYIARRAQLKESLKSPYPTFEKVEEVLGFRVYYDVGCYSCIDAGSMRIKAIKMMALDALKNYPQEISGFPSRI